VLGLLVDPEYGDSIFLRNVSRLWTTWHYIPEDRTLHSHPCENLRSYISGVHSKCQMLWLCSKYERYIFDKTAEVGAPIAGHLVCIVGYYV
jgi:hypothetical protein